MEPWSDNMNATVKLFPWAGKTCISYPVDDNVLCYVQSYIFSNFCPRRPARIGTRIYNTNTISENRLLGIVEPEMSNRKLVW